MKRVLFVLYFLIRNIIAAEPRLLLLAAAMGMIALLWRDLASSGARALDQPVASVVGTPWPGATIAQDGRVVISVLAPPATETPEVQVAESAAKGTSGALTGTLYYVHLAEEAARRHGIDAALFLRQIQIESGFDPNAVSPAGCYGLAQLHPAYYPKALYSSPEANVDKGAAIVRENLDLFAGDYAKALAAYHDGVTGVQNAIARCGDNWKTCLSSNGQLYLKLLALW